MLSKKAFLRSKRQGVFYVCLAFRVTCYRESLFLLHNIQISKINEKKGSNLVDFCKGGSERIQICSFLMYMCYFGTKMLNIQKAVY